MSGRGAARWLLSLPARAAVTLVRLYQIFISPLLGPSCRFHPTCSSYACRCLVDHGVVRGGWLTLRRLSRCHPFHPGGVDLPPPRRELTADRGSEPRASTGVP